MVVCDYSNVGFFISDVEEEFFADVEMSMRGNVSWVAGRFDVCCGKVSFVVRVLKIIF